MKIIAKIKDFDRNKSYPDVVTQPNTKLIPMYAQYVVPGEELKWGLFSHIEVPLDDPRTEIRSTNIEG